MSLISHQNVHFEELIQKSFLKSKNFKKLSSTYKCTSIVWSMFDENVTIGFLQAIEPVTTILQGTGCGITISKDANAVRGIFHGM